MKWFDNFIARCVQRHQQYGECEPQTDNRWSGKMVSSRGGTRSGEALQGKGMNFALYSASGGYVLEYRVYNSKTDEHENTLHLIPSDQDLGQSIGHAITLEMLRK